jgi:hypothetical protein
MLDIGIEFSRSVFPQLLGYELTRAVQQLALMDVRRRHPTATAREQSLLVAARWLDSTLMKRAFAWNLDEVGL